MELAQTPSGIERLRLYYSRNEGRVAAAFFAAGFTFDIVTTGRIDSWLTIAQQAAYLAVITGILLHMFLEQDQPAPDLAGKSVLVRWYYDYRNALVHFLMGALLSLYAIFYFKSSSLLVSFGFLGFLVVLLLANELKRIQSLGLPFKFALLGLCWLAYASYVLPVFVGQTGLVIFLLSMAAGCVPLVLVALRIPQDKRRAIRIPLGCVVIGFLGFYLFRLIPPVPLSIPFMGVYHGVERTDLGYKPTHERAAWRLWENGDQQFRAQPGDKVHVYFRIFSPARFADQVSMKWYLYKSEVGRWVLQDTIPIKILGGREEGFRGYGVKSHYDPGEWKVQVETSDGREIGRIYFTLETAPDSPRGLVTELD